MEMFYGFPHTSREEEKTPATTRMDADTHHSSPSSSSNPLTMSSPPLPPEFHVYQTRPQMSHHSLPPYPMLIPFQIPAFCSGASVFPELPPIGVGQKGMDGSVKSEPMQMEDSSDGRKHKRKIQQPRVVPSHSYKKEIQRQSALQMKIQNIEQRRKKGTLCLGNFLFGCTADRPKVNTIRPFGRCDRCLAGRSVPLQRTRMSKIKQFADEKRQTLIPGSHGQPPIRCQRYPNVFGNWALLVFATMQDAENATALLGEAHGEPSLVQTSSVLPENVWANGVPFMRSGKYNKLVPKPIDNTSVVPATKIQKPLLKPNELARNIDDISKEWGTFDQVHSYPWSSFEQKFQSALTAEQLASPAEMEDVTEDSPRTSRLALMFSLCDCGAARCLHRFNPNSWVVLNEESTRKCDPPIRWLNYDDLNNEDISESGPHHIIFTFKDFPGRSIETKAYFVESILSRRFEFRLPIPPSHLLERCTSLKANVTFRDSGNRITVECEPFSFVPSSNTGISEDNPFWTPRTPTRTSPTTKKEEDSNAMQH